MSGDNPERLVVAISSRALFDMSEGHDVFEREGVDAYCRYQVDREADVLRPGVAFRLVRKLLNLRPSDARVEVILLSRNSADTGLRVFNSIEHYGLAITRAAFTNGASPWRYVQPFGGHLFLSAGRWRRALRQRPSCPAPSATSRWSRTRMVNCGSRLTVMR